MWEYGGMCGKHEKVCGNMKKYMGNMKEYEGNLKESNCLLHVGSGTWKNSEHPPKLWKMKKFRALSFFLSVSGYILKNFLWIRGIACICFVYSFLIIFLFFFLRK